MVDIGLSGQEIMELASTTVRAEATPWSPTRRIADRTHRHSY